MWLTRGSGSSRWQEPFEKIEREVTSVVFSYTPFERLRELYVPKLRRLPGLRELILEKCDLDTLAQLSALSQVPSHWPSHWPSSQWLLRRPSH